MKKYNERVVVALIVSMSFFGYMVGCTHDDEILTSKGPDITRGTDKVSLGNTSTSFDKAHSNVQWSTQYLGSTALLTGRFDNFGCNIFEFDEPTAENIRFETWVWLNSVNTSEPARDDGCLLTTFGTTGTATTEDENLAIIRSKTVTLSTTDKGYNVTADLTFHGVTKEITCKMSYDGKVASGSNFVYGFSLQFQFLAKTDFLIESSNIGDNVDVKCNVNFKGP